MRQIRKVAFRLTGFRSKTPFYKRIDNAAGTAYFLQQLRGFQAGGDGTKMIKGFLLPGC
jgi:hypothetical protein